MRYEVGDYVRIKNIHIDDDYPSGVVDDMLDFSNKLARITDMNTDCYHIDIDNGKWDWDEDMFDYRLGNYDDNKYSNIYYKVGYKIEEWSDKIYTFEGNIDNFAPCGKSVFVNENGVTLALPWNMIEYIIPLEKERELKWEQ